MDELAARSANYVREDVAFPSCGVNLRGWLFLPRRPAAPAPAIVMAPGNSGVKEGTLHRFAHVFASAGFAVVAYDNINFGESDALVPQEADAMLQRRGYRDAITFATLRPEIDKARIGIWGSSAAGGHVLEVAAHDRRVKCVVSQIPSVSGFQRFQRMVRPELREAYLARLDADREARFHGEPPQTQKAVSDVAGEPCAMPGKAAFDYFMEQARHAPNWKNELTLQSGDITRGVENQAFIPYIWPTPLLMIVAMQDELAPPDLAVSAFQTAREPKKLLLIEGDHFSPYKLHFELVTETALDWFETHLGGARATSHVRG